MFNRGVCMEFDASPRSCVAPRRLTRRFSLPRRTISIVRCYVCRPKEAMREGEVDRTACLIRMITLIVGAVAAVLAIVAVMIYARRALKQALVVRMCLLYHLVLSRACVYFQSVRDRRRPRPVFSGFFFLMLMVSPSSGLRGRSHAKSRVVVFFFFQRDLGASWPAQQGLLCLLSVTPE